MAEITTLEIRDFLSSIQGKEITLSDLRKEFNILPGTKSFDAVRNIMFQLAEQKIVHPAGRRNGIYKVVTQVSPVPVFSVQRERRPPFDLCFPRDFENMMEMSFAESVVIREGDLVTIGGVKSKGKTTLCLNFAGENINKNPVLMGNEYTTLVDGIYEPTPRFSNRLETMAEWIQWTDDKGNDKLILLPVRDDYAEHIVKDKLNIVDWINIDTGEHYMIGTVLEGIKKNLGRGVAIVALQKSEIANDPRGGQFARDFSDLEIALDGFGSNDEDILLTIRGVKEKPEGHQSVVGKRYAYTIAGNGVKILNFREVKRCPACGGRGNKMGKECELCLGRKFINK